MKKYIELIRPVNLVLNILVFCLGAIISTKYGIIVNNFIIGLISFLLLYSGIYIFNDLIDIESDKKHEVLSKRDKPLVTGKISKSFAIKIMLLTIISGLILSLTVNKNFNYFLITVLLINLIYSGLKLKDNPVIGISLIIVIQVIKLTLGWLSLNNELTSIPLITFFTYGCGYSLSLAFYKIKRFKTKKQFNSYTIILLIFTLITFFISIIIYPKIRNALIIISMILFLGGALLNKFKNKLLDEYSKSIKASILIISLIIISLILT